MHINRCDVRHESIIKNTCLHEDAWGHTHVKENQMNQDCVLPNALLHLVRMEMLWLDRTFAPLSVSLLDLENNFAIPSKCIVPGVIWNDYNEKRFLWTRVVQNRLQSRFPGTNSSHFRVIVKFNENTFRCNIRNIAHTFFISIPPKARKFSIITMRC